MATERVVWYLWADSLVLAIPNNSGQSDSGQSDRCLVTCTPKNIHKPCRDKSHVNVLVYNFYVHFICLFHMFMYGYSMFEIELCTCRVIQQMPHSISAELYFDSSITDNHFQLCTRELEICPLRVSHVKLVDTWPCDNLTRQNYLEWQEPRNWLKDTRPPFLQPFC